MNSNRFRTQLVTAVMTSVIVSAIVSVSLLYAYTQPGGLSETFQLTGLPTTITQPAATSQPAPPATAPATTPEVAETVSATNPAPTTTVAAAVPAGKVEDQKTYVLSTATKGGTFYPVGVALATLAKVKLIPQHGVGMTAVTSAGSAENVNRLRNRESEFAILQGLYGAMAVQGTGPFTDSGPQDYIRSVAVLWQNVEHFIVRRELVRTGDLSDMRYLTGHKISLGRKNSGTLGSNRVILGSLGIDVEAAYSLEYLGYGPSSKALRDGVIHAMGTPGGVPVSAVTQAFGALGDDISLLEVTESQLKGINKGLGSLWTPYTIPAGTYPGVDEPLRTIAQPNILAVHKDTPEEDVYLITKAIFENIPFLHAIHPSTRSMGLETALAGMVVPLHPGALRYYTEIGIAVPTRLYVADSGRGATSKGWRP